MNTEMHLLKNNDKRDWSDLEWLNEFYEFLQGSQPEGIMVNEDHAPKLKKETAFAIIWYLQEQLPVFSDTIEQCSVCFDLFDSASSGYYSEKEGSHYCAVCDNGEDEYSDPS